MSNWLKRKYDYVKHINRNFTSLKNQTDILFGKADAVIKTSREDNNSTKERTQDCKRWLRRVETIRYDFSKLRNEYENRPSTCFCGLCPYRALHKLGKRIVKATIEAAALTDEFSTITPTREKPEPNPRRWDNDKTYNKSFGNWKHLGMTTDGDSDPVERASKISEMLENKKYVLFLDYGVSSPSTINLEEVGIHPNHEQGKVVFACRDKYIGHTDEDMKVQKLSKEDATMLFWEFAGSYRERRDLENLEILDVSGIYSLPSEVRQLTKLKCLRVSFSDGGMIQNHVRSGVSKILCFLNFNSSSSSELMIPGNTISKLTNLEELSLNVSHNIARWNKNADAIAKEVNKLKKLSHLQFYFTNLESFNTFIQESQSWNAKDSSGDFIGFRTFRLFVGEQRNSSTSDFNVFECSDEKHLNFSTGDVFPHTISNVLRQAKSFELMGHTTAGNLTDNLPADTLEELEACLVEECNKMQSIVKFDTNATGGEIVFKRLQKLHAKRLPDLEGIWDGTIPSTYESFPALRTLTLMKCNGIRILFSLQMVEQLPQLENLQIEDCSNIEKIIEAEITVVCRAFRRLKNFKLCRLDSLTSICEALLEWPALETIQIKTCPVLTSLPSTVERAPNLREIQCPGDWWDQQNWPNNATEEHFRTLRRLLI
ncbi:disease resistance protein [Corchorus capsularis]|uniref:Disease resistance protein n=1 Tax=Corchorus capsularis TaxID=210143 RepID=A0A1R3JXA5_COCAP|nr:disease resistance protein [Corchorus capsularis]